MCYSVQPSFFFCLTGRFLPLSVMPRTLRCLRLSSSKVKSESFAPQKGKLKHSPPFFYSHFTHLLSIYCIYAECLCVCAYVRARVQRLALGQSSWWSPCIRQQGRVCEDGSHATRAEMGPDEHACGWGGGKFTSQIPCSATKWVRDIIDLMYKSWWNDCRYLLFQISKYGSL